MSETACIDEALQEIFQETDLLAFQTKLVFDKQLTRLEHFYDVTDGELKTYGLSEPAIRRLRAAIERRRKKRAKLFSKGKRHVRLVQVKRAAPAEERPGFEFNTMQPFLIPKNEINLLETLGEGNFSIVRRACWTRSDGAKTECAVKILHEMSDAVRQDLAVEISNMQKLRHQNLVQLFGVVFDKDSTLMVIEFCEGGSLLNRLRDRTKPKPLVTTLLNYAQQIANGMSYLESRRCVHRDLAARNVLLSHEEQIIKICDFGLTRALSENQRLYVMNEPKKVPFSWCPPESLRYRQFSHKSDVWAFGVTLWELFTFGEEPWIGSRAAEVLQLIESGQRLRKPECCPAELHEIMKLCWAGEAEERPKFSHLRKMLMDFKFMHIVCRQQNIPSTQQGLPLAPGEEIILIGESSSQQSDIWFGQSMGSRAFGEFPRTCVASQLRNGNGPGMGGNGVVQQQGKNISFPVAGSFIHTGHGDIDERRCWGHVDHIEDIYLRNPIVSPSSIVDQQSMANNKVTFIPSVLNAHKPGTAINLTAIEQLGSSENSTPSSTLPVTAPQTRPYSQSAVQTHSQPETLSTNRSSAPSTSNPSAADAFEWISQELAQLSARSAAQPNRSSSMVEDGQMLTALEPPPQPTKLLNFGMQANDNGKSNGSSSSAGSSISSKYDSSISIPRPNRTSPVNTRLTPPPISADSFNPTTTKSTSLGPSTGSAIGQKLASCSLPSSTSTLAALGANGKGAENGANQVGAGQPPASARPQMFIGDTLVPTTANMTVGNVAMQQRGDDPFLVNDNVKTLTAKLSYREVHKATDFLGGEEKPRAATLIVNSIPSCSSSTSMQQHQQEEQRPSNVAVVYPFVQQKQQVNDQKQQKLPEIPANMDKKSGGIGSLLPPPSELLLSGFGGKVNAAENQEKKNGLHYQPIFDISGHSAHQMNLTKTASPNSTNHPRIRYGSNGIPILEPMPAPTVQIATTKINSHQQQQMGTGKATQSAGTGAMVTLNELDTDALLNRVKASVDFASADQCRQFLWRNGFDVDAAIRELKIEKLIEMGLATDRELAASALDCEKWDVNAAANRLCCL